ncbi:BTAD domain-containing putative transcriptional regulator [Solwaraspora sp. WMMA2101]|uniref:BTAD domain-containing putative transcriptional regulator n=1 Tax=Solwaraspora sp. WMMA2101 TaxID=3404124 RepID=UPI003B92817A
MVAAAGYGKTTALLRWFPPSSARWWRGSDTTPQRLLDETRSTADDRPVIVDDLPRLSADEAQAMAAVVDDLPHTATVVLSGRWPLAAPVASGVGRHRWQELGPTDLALTAEAVAELLAVEHGLSDPGLADQVHGATGGWPALVALTAETLRLDGVPPGDLVRAVSQPGSPLATYLTGEVLAGLPSSAVRLLRCAADLAPFSADLGRALGHRQATVTVRLLRRIGLLTRVGAAPVVPGASAPMERVVPVVAEVVRQRQPTRQHVDLASNAAAWYDQHGPPVAAARAYRRAGVDAQAARVLAEHGDRMLAAGQAAEVAELVAGLPEPLVSRRLRLLLGDALRTIGDLTAAEQAYDAAAGPEWDAGLAWRVGRIHYQRGDAQAALDTFARACAEGGRDSACGGRDSADGGRPSSSPDVVLLLAWTAHAQLLAGEVEVATGYARQALAAAATTTSASGDSVGSDGALATAHLGMALCRAVAGDAAGSEEHFAIAQPIAERIGDVLLLTRIHTNRTYQLLRTARYAEALVAAQLSARYAAVAAAPSLHAIAISNEAEALAMLGRYDEAAARYATALTRYQRAGSRRFANAMLGMAELYRRRGWREQARAGYEEVVRVGEAIGNTYVLVPALAGLALVVLDDDATAAASYADRATDLAVDEFAVPALLARGWVARRGGDLADAAALADRAAQLARARRDRAGLADALELRAATATSPVRVRESLREAQAIWSGTGARLEADRLLVVLGRLSTAGTDDRLEGLLAAERLAAAGAQVDRPGTRATPPAGTAASAGTGTSDGTGPSDGGGVSIRALGRFEVRLAGRPVPASQWQSRKARDLLRILVARRGRPVPRGELSELLWPGDEPERTGHRLSVLLSIVRGVLDPAKDLPADHFIVADQGSIALDLTNVRVDVEDFLAQVAHGRRLLERAMLEQARTMLRAADREYRADVFEDEPYDDWSRPLREQARAAYLDMLRMLARADRADAVGCLLRLLERDPYDEPAHRGLVRALVAAGQHGEARRAFDRYAEAMREIGVRPPDRLLLMPTRPRPGAGAVQ